VLLTTPVARPSSICDRSTPNLDASIPMRSYFSSCAQRVLKPWRFAGLGDFWKCTFITQGLVIERQLPFLQIIITERLCFGTKNRHRQLDPGAAIWRQSDFQRDRK